ncbi:molybdopterin molybdotransferase MoeA [Erythrobacter ani]|uniref:Molybdopterin molybdenumtransferase n=1 Tax=Erythrobacter ani TaxID=2827235 RepID=A0ABS6SRD0_9SPHN|nr:molybdopterin molybdotransferase MoeA [Erythrobacter ani]MBV7267002.1 molybdopterin molybdotransferase MoeA [Erythrobacter ani]
MAAMLTLEEAQERLLALAPIGETERIVTDKIADSRYLAEDLQALRTQPSADLSAMDGYAICGEGPWLKVGESRAGTPFSGALEPGQCTRISTGAHMPNGSDRVLIQENACLNADLVHLAESETLPEAQRHVRSRGFDFAEGDRLLTAGTSLGPAQLALALASGHGKLPVRALPRVAVLDSGDELVRDPLECGPDQIPASNGAMIGAMLRPLVGEVARLGPVPDDKAALAEALAQAENCDILITSGGASVGDHDLVRQALKDWGADLAFWKVAIKPGKPLMVATRGKQVIVGLPGNPVSSFVTCFLFALPLVRAALGAANPLPPVQHLSAGENLPEVGSRREFLRGISDGAHVRRAASQDSSALLALASANCLIERPACSAAVSNGEQVAVYNLQNG